MNNKQIKENIRKQLNDDTYLTFITRKSFDSADKNKNGAIDIKELKACMIDIAHGMGRPIPDDEIAKREFVYLDKDRNNTIDFEEFKQFVKKNMLMMIDALPD